jgi:hypothetical protein
MTADAEFSGETPAPRPAGERAAEEIVQGLCNCQGAEQAGHRDGCLTRRVAAALTATHEAAVSPVAPMVCRVCGAPATMVVLNDYCDAHDPDEAHEAARLEGERALEEHLVGCDAEALEWALTKANSRAQAAEAALAQAQRERDEFQRKYHEAMDVLTAWGNLDSAEAVARALQAERALAQARAALESTREALFSYRSLAYGYAPMKTLEEYDDKHERALLPPPGEKP